MPKRNVIWVVAIVAAALVVVWVTRSRPVLPAGGDGGRLQPVQQTFHLIKTKHYRAIEDEALCRGAVQGMIEALNDPYSTYIPPDQAEAVERRVTTGLQRGIGLEFEIRGGQVRIAWVQVNSPACRARLVPGDRIVAIDGIDLVAPTGEEVEAMLDGPLGTDVELMIARDDSEPTGVTLTRSEYPIESVEGLCRDEQDRWVYLIDPEQGIAYVRIKEMVADTGEQFQVVLRRLGGLRGLVLDVRDNPGGTLQVAVKIGDMFLRKGLIVTTVGQGGQLRRHHANPDGTFPNVPLVVLIDERTASAAEVLAGALRLHHRSVLVGTPTRGKGCVQSIFSLAEGLGKVSLTTSQFYLGRYGSISGQGVAPHIPVRLDETCLEALHAQRRRAGMIGAPWPATRAADDMPRHQRMVTKLLSLDAQLNRAVRLLRAPQVVEAILEKAARAQRAAEKADSEKVPGDDG